MMSSFIALANSKKSLTFSSLLVFSSTTGFSVVSANGLALASSSSFSNSAILASIFLIKSSTLTLFFFGSSTGFSSLRPINSSYFLLTRLSNSFSFSSLFLPWLFSFSNLSSSSSLAICASMFLTNSSILDDLSLFIPLLIDGIANGGTKALPPKFGKPFIPSSVLLLSLVGYPLIESSKPHPPFLALNISKLALCFVLNGIFLKRLIIISNFFICCKSLTVTSGLIGGVGLPSLASFGLASPKSLLISSSAAYSVVIR